MTEVAAVRERYEEFCSKFEGLLAEYKDALAPDYDPLGDNCPHGSDEDCECKPGDNLVVTEWVVLGCYLDLDTEKMPVIGVSPPTQRATHTLGLIEFYKKVQGW